MLSLTILLFLVTINLEYTFAQTITSSIPEKVNASEKYLFYLHGGIVQQQGVNAVSKIFGPYEFLKILDTLKNHGFRVISEARPKTTDEVEYAAKVASQIDTLLNFGVPPNKITVVGASQGAYIAIETAYKLKNPKINYVVLAVCNDYNVNYYSKYKKGLCGNFLSIYESSDQKLSCDRLLKNLPCKSSYTEVSLNMGNGHGFIYRPYKEWVQPLVNWINGFR